LVVKQEVRYELLKRFVAKCIELHSIAFLQWRRLFVASADQEVLEDLILSRISNQLNKINYMYKPTAATV
jgi:hypothetical protein